MARFGRIQHEFILDGEPQYVFDSYEEEIDDDTTMGELYRNLRSWHGRCDSSVYVDTNEGVKKVGWHFVKRADDGNGCIGTWATVYEREVKRVYL